VQCCLLCLVAMAASLFSGCLRTMFVMLTFTMLKFHVLYHHLLATSKFFRLKGEVCASCVRRCNGV